MTAVRPQVVVLAGPNGAGKTTASSLLLPEVVEVYQFVNADVIARGLAGFAPDSAAVAAGRLMLERIRELAEQGVNFAFETTFASRSFAPQLHRMIAERDYMLHLIYLWLPTPEMAVERVRHRVARGGHGVPDEVVRRRWRGSLRNFFELYIPLAASWRFYDNSGDRPRIIARRLTLDSEEEVVHPAMWQRVRAEAGL